MLKKKGSAAQKDLAKAADLYPGYAPPWSELGSALVKQGKPDESAAALAENQGEGPTNCRLPAAHWRSTRWNSPARIITAPKRITICIGSGNRKQICARQSSVIPAMNFVRRVCCLPYYWRAALREHRRW